MEIIDSDQLIKYQKKIVASEPTHGMPEHMTYVDVAMEQNIEWKSHKEQETENYTKITKFCE